MKTKFIKVISCLLFFVMLMSVFVGCETNEGGVNTQEKETETQQVDETPKEPINLNDYFIIVPDNAMNKSVEGLAANELRAMLSDLGFSVRIKDDNGSAEEIGENVILLGKTADRKSVV